MAVVEPTVEELHRLPPSEGLQWTRCISPCSPTLVRSRAVVSRPGAVVQRLGVGGLSRGLQARLVHVGIIVTMQLVLYDTLKHAFGVP